jgi:uncharacterized membrane protein YedE/YeeE
VSAVAATPRAPASEAGSAVALHAKLVVMGASLGFALARMGFTSWDEVHAMFTLADFRLYLTFLVGVVTLGAIYAVIRARSRPEWAPRPLERGTIAGGVLFGLGWAISGACPGVVFAQLGEGRAYAVLALGGMLAGNALAGVLERRAPLPR